MRKQTKTLVEIGILYLCVSILLDFFLGSFQILLLPALALEFLFFGIMIMSTLSERVAPRTRKQEKSAPQVDDALTRLEHLCKLAINEGDQAARSLLSERVKSLAFAAAANHFNASETSLRTDAQKQPDVLESIVRDPQLFNAMTMTTSFVRQSDTQSLEQLLAKIEGWIK